MYLARERIQNQNRYVIRQSIQSGGLLTSRDLFDLGTDPTRFIIYPGGNSYYYDTDIIDALAEKGVDVDQTALDPIFFEFLHPEIKRIIKGFDRSSKKTSLRRKSPTPSAAPPLHLFDKRRYHFLRFGARLRQHIHRQPDSLFRPLLNKSRDEVEQYFLKEEQILRPHEIASYVATIFQLKQFAFNPSSNQTAQVQLDRFFMDHLCALDCDKRFWAGTPETQHLHHHLIKYAIMYFDFNLTQVSWQQRYINDFIRDHRIHRPLPKIQVKIEEAETLFGLSWKALKKLDRTALTRKYRRLALKHHPDQGGDPDRFNRITQIYKTLLGKKP